jgi:hypothetical protein
MVSTTPITRIKKKKKFITYINIINLCEDKHTSCGCVQYKIFELQYV